MTKLFSWHIIFGIFIGASVGIISFYLMENLPTFGRNIPIQDISSDYFRGVFCAIGLTALIFVIPCRQEERLPLLFLWWVRSLVTLVYMLFYEYTYGLDAYSYYTNAIDLNVSLDASQSSFHGTYIVSQLARFLVQNVPFLASYHALKVVWSFFGYLATFIIYKAYSNYTRRYDNRLLLILGLFPSIIFWSSILGKDPLTFFGIALMFYGALPLFKRFNFGHFVIACLGLYIAGAVRTWLIVVFGLPFAIIYMLKSKTGAATKVPIFIVSIFAVGYFTVQILQQVNVSSDDEAFSAIGSISKSWNRGGSSLEMGALTSPAEMIKFLPIGSFTALFRPLPGEVNSIFGLLAGIEDLLLLIGVIYSIYRSTKKIRSDILVQYLVATLVIWSMFYSFISYQNLGTAVRFKLQVLPFLILLIYYVRTLYRPNLSPKAIESSSRATKVAANTSSDD